MKFGIVYKSTCLVTNKIYIGKTLSTLHYRMNSHRRESFYKHRKDYNAKFHSSIRKYGFENFRWELIQDEIPEDLLDIVEIYQIAIHNSYYDGLNSTHGGDKGSKVAWNKGLTKSDPRVLKYVKPRTKQHIQAMCNANRGRKHTEEEKLKMSIAKKGKPWTENRRNAQK